MDKNINIDQKLIDYIFSHTNNLHPVQNELIKFNKIFNKPKICEKYLELYIKKESNTFSKFIIDMNETTSLCIDKYVYYYILYCFLSSKR